MWGSSKNILYNAHASSLRISCDHDSIYILDENYETLWNLKASAASMTLFLSGNIYQGAEISVFILEPNNMLLWVIGASYSTI
jgi:hypothetical protein